MAVANDAGVSISTTRGRTWLRVQLPIAQMYHVTVDNQIPYYVYGNKQDGPSYRGPSNSRSGNTIPRSEWHGVLAARAAGRLPIRSTRTSSGRPRPAAGSAAASSRASTARRDRAERRSLAAQHRRAFARPIVKYRFVWDAPFTISPHDHNRDLHRQPVRAHDDGRRPELAGDQPRSHAQRQDASSRSRAASRRTTSASSTATSSTRSPSRACRRA